MPTGVHFVGSFPNPSLPNATSVFTHSLSLCPSRLSRLPDGELGTPRAYYCAFDSQYFPPQVLHTSNPVSKEKLNPTYVPRIEDIADLSYDKHAVASYAEFAKAKAAGTIPAHVRFQVSVPNACDGVGHVHAAFKADVAPLYELKTIECIRRIQRGIPAGELAVQLDVANTIATMEYQRGNLVGPLGAYGYMFEPFSDDMFQYAVQSLSRTAASLGTEAELGFHLCYGDIEHKHWLEPADLSLPVRIANRLSEMIERPIAWMHMPVPKDRTDAAYFAPLADLRLPQETQLFLGLVHQGDLVGTKQRIEAAKGFWPRDFGVATECGMGRTPPEHLDDILQLCTEVSRPYDR